LDEDTLSFAYITDTPYVAAYNLLFPDLNLRTCYSLNDFKDDYADWKKDLPTPPPNLINLDDAIKFLGDNQ